MKPEHFMVSDCNHGGRCPWSVVMNMLGQRRDVSVSANVVQDQNGIRQ